MATVTDQRLSVEHIRRNEKRIVETPKLGSRPWLHFIAGGVSGTVGAVLTCPLEVVKTRMQSSFYRTNIVTSVSHAHRRTLLSPFIDTLLILRSVYYQEGVGALFKGLGPNLVGVIPSRAIQFFVYGNGKRLFTELNGGKETTMIHLTSAVTAGIATATATNPIWLVKTRMQLQSNGQNAMGRRYRNSLDCIVQVVRTEGIRGLYRGLSASYLGVTEGTLQWVTYEHLKKILRERHEHRTHELGATQKWLETLLAAGAAKLCAAVATYPHEVVRTRLREVPQGARKYHGLVGTVRTIVREEGFRALYGGLPAHLMRVVPNAAIMFFCYETIMATFGPKNDRT